jgi:hypothetical protein
LNSPLSYALLIVAYARAENLSRIVETALQSGVNRIYIVLDVSSTNKKIQSEQKRIEAFVQNIKLGSDISLRLNVRDRNIGCSANLLSGIDWAFTNEECLAILEDDCIPTSDFFEFTDQALRYIENRDDVWISGGFRVFPHLFPDQSVLTKYPITWGWATTRKKWLEMREILVNQERTFHNFDYEGCGMLEKVYWRAGARRSYQGFIDAWDIPLALAFLSENKSSLLPGASLVSNVGDDEFATHTSSKSSGISQSVGVFQKDKLLPVASNSLNRSIVYDHFKIRRRYLFTTKIRAMCDLFSSTFGSEVKNPLMLRWKQAKIK